MRDLLPPVGQTSAWVRRFYDLPPYDPAMWGPDDVVPAPAVIDWARGLAPAPELALLPAAGHFFHGHINELRDVVVSFLTRVAARATAP